MSALHRPHAPPARAAALPPEDSLRIARLLDHTLNDVQRLYVDLLACLTSARRVDPSTGRALPPLDGDALERQALVAALAELRHGLTEFEACRAALRRAKPAPDAG